MKRKTGVSPLELRGTITIPETGEIVVADFFKVDISNEANVKISEIDEEFDRLFPDQAEEV